MRWTEIIIRSTKAYACVISVAITTVISRSYKHSVKQKIEDKKLDFLTTREDSPI